MVLAADHEINYGLTYFMLLAGARDFVLCRHVMMRWRDAKISEVMMDRRLKAHRMLVGCLWDRISYIFTVGVLELLSRSSV